MKLASLKSGRDGKLVVVSNDLAWYADAGHIAPTLQAALDDWDRVFAVDVRATWLLAQAARAALAQSRGAIVAVAGPAIMAGVADANDSQRPDFLVNHLRAVQEARAAGVPVEGYCYWSLLDNFEWAEGFGPRFGLYQVDYATGERTQTQSAEIFTRIAGENQL